MYMYTRGLFVVVSLITRGIVDDCRHALNQQLCLLFDAFSFLTGSTCKQQSSEYIGMIRMYWSLLEYHRLPIKVCASLSHYLAFCVHLHIHIFTHGVPHMQCCCCALHMYPASTQRSVQGPHSNKNVASPSASMSLGLLDLPRTSSGSVMDFSQDAYDPGPDLDLSVHVNAQGHCNPASMVNPSASVGEGMLAARLVFPFVTSNVCLRCMCAGIPAHEAPRTGYPDSELKGPCSWRRLH